MLLMHQQICSRRPIQAPTGVFPPNESAGLSARSCVVQHSSEVGLAAIRGIENVVSKVNLVFYMAFLFFLSFGFWLIPFYEIRNEVKVISSLFGDLGTRNKTKRSIGRIQRQDT